MDPSFFASYLYLESRASLCAPENVLTFKSKSDALAKLFDSYAKELKKVKEKLGDSAKKEEIKAEFEKVIDKKYGEHAITDSMEALSKAMNSFGIAEMTADVNENK